MSLGAFTFVLHSHMPYVLSHGRSPHGSDWLCEAAAESYLPMLDVLARLAAEGISPKITLGLTPVLIEQLSDPRFEKEFDRYLLERADMARRDHEGFQTIGDEHTALLAHHWHQWYGVRRQEFHERWSCDIVGAFKTMQDAGHIEIIAGSATHGYCPLLGEDSTIAAQVAVGVRTYAETFGRNPRGYWLPECAYHPGRPGRRSMEEMLAAERIEYFIAESHHDDSVSSTGLSGERMDALALRCGVSNALAADPISPYYPLAVNSTGAQTHNVCAFFRDPATGVQVWSTACGYPGDPWYLDFHKHNSGSGSIFTGLRYWRVTSGSDKSLYEPNLALQRTQAHAEHFAALVEQTLSQKAPDGDGILCATYDTELFGHWWFEGPEFLYAAIKALAARPGIVRSTCCEYIDTHSMRPAGAALPEGSWGAGGNHSVWRNSDNAWIWTRIWGAEATMKRLAARHASDRRVERLLAQAARELLLLTSSDWPFLITAGSARDYAETRFNNHCTHFNVLASLIDTVDAGYELTASNWKALAVCEQQDRIYPRIDPRLFIDPNVNP